MLERALFVLTIVGGASLGIFWPVSEEASTTEPAELEVTLDRQPDRHFYAEVAVNGKPLRFLIDTGASENALTEEDARKIGIPIDPAKYEFLGHGASGMVRGQYVQLDTVDLGGISTADARAVVVQGANVSLLGQPFLEDIDEIVIRKDEMILRKQAS